MRITLSAKCAVAMFPALVACAPAFGAEQRYPTKPIRFIIPTSPGGGSDLVAGMLGQKYTAAWGQQVVIDHRAGAGMTIGIDLAAKSAPDGYTLVLVNPSHAINATLMPKLPYDPVRDLTPVTTVATQPYGMVVSQQLPAKTVKEVIALAKAKPREINYASSGNGSASHLAGEMFVRMAGVQMTHVPYKGTGTVIPDLISNRVSVMINPMLALINYVKAGQLRAIAVTSAKRVSSMPDLPTVAEAGVPGYEAISWYMVLVPSKTPSAIVNQLYTESAKAIQSEDMRDMLTRAGTEPLGSSPSASTEFLKIEIARWGKVIKEANVKVD